ncbi:DUF2357 domain-containing protein [Metabacillus malikii]|uniref:Component of viral defense system (DUF524 family) n=1 Tax=Metabacillus malikii TaxID=1504265 RepID=A0ABT9ZIR6_9BACI|nr:DUF2357 domain-containing protein [Metabacillus malikii]MDQ0231799.1 putative component of viral defense system (DUF524 family) [Metabacillus malikii]
MAPHNSGVNITVWDERDNSWVPLNKVYLQEAMQYRWRARTNEAFRLTMQSISLPMTRTDVGWEGVFETPFQSGGITFAIVGKDKNQMIENYVYTDERKLTEQQYKVLLEDILNEAAICFQQSGLHTSISASGFTRECSMLQWMYIETSMHKLRTIFRNIDAKPLRHLYKDEVLLKRERVKYATPRSIAWVERYGQGFGGTPTKLPSHIQTTKVEESFNVYEHRVIVMQLNELEHLLKNYRTLNDEEIKVKATRYLDWISLWKKAHFLQGLSAHSGTLNTTQVFRKHPVYRLWYKWFQALYQFKTITFDLERNISLKDTYLLYEIWCYMQIIRVIRENGLLMDAGQLFMKKDDFYFLRLAENKESVVELTNGARLIYQKIIQFNTCPYYSYTQRMIPDIVIDYQNHLYVMDPKYRVPANLPMALGEMHKYRDGIIHRDNDLPVVKEVYILTPTESHSTSEKNFYHQKFQERYGMGTFRLSPEENSHTFQQWLKRIFT